MATQEKTFEEMMERLEEITGLLEENKQPLDQSLDLFQEGIMLVKECNTKLKSFEDKANAILEKEETDDEL